MPPPPHWIAPPSTSEELEKVKAQLGDAGRYDEGATLFDQITASEDFVDFLTLPAYQMID